MTKKYTSHAINLGYHPIAHPGRTTMPTATKWLAVFVATAAFASLAQAQDSPNRKEMKRADLSGTKMEVILSTAEYKPGEMIARHIHHGEEAFYVIQGATVETPDGKKIELKTGSGSINLRDVPHGGFKVVGDTPLKLVTVHIVDKGAPLYDAPPK
jgi:quercetin dioxygenase-like cupin family protein